MDWMSYVTKENAGLAIGVASLALELGILGAVFKVRKQVADHRDMTYLQKVNFGAHTVFDETGESPTLLLRSPLEVNIHEWLDMPVLADNTVTAAADCTEEGPFTRLAENDRLLMVTAITNRISEICGGQILSQAVTGGDPDEIPACFILSCEPDKRGIRARKQRVFITSERLLRRFHTDKRWVKRLTTVDVNHMDRIPLLERHAAMVFGEVTNPYDLAHGHSYVMGQVGIPRHAVPYLLKDRLGAGERGQF